MSKPNPELSHMPDHIKQNIVNKIGDCGSLWKMKESLGLVSKDFYRHVAESPKSWTSVDLILESEKVTVEMTPYYHGKKLIIEFCPHGKGALKKNPVSDWKIILEEEDYRKAAVHYALAYFNNKKSRVRVLHLRVSYSLLAAEEGALYQKEVFETDKKIVLDEMKRVLETNFKRKLLVENICFEFQVTDAEIHSILVHLEPGTLEGIHLDSEFPETDTPNPTLHLEKVCATDQWKRVKHLNVLNYEVDILFEDWIHFEEVRMRWKLPTVSVKTILQTFLGRQSFWVIAIESPEVFDKTGLDYYVEKFEKYPGALLTPTKFTFLPNEDNIKISVKTETNQLKLKRRNIFR